MHKIEISITDEEINTIKDFYRAKHYVFLVDLIINKIKKGDIKLDGEDLKL